MSEYECNKCDDTIENRLQQLESMAEDYYKLITINANLQSTLEKLETTENKKSEWLQFNCMTIRKSAITSYHKMAHTDTYFVVGVSFNNSNCPGEVFKTAQGAQARFDEIDKEIREC